MNKRVLERWLVRVAKSPSHPDPDPRLSHEVTDKPANLRSQRHNDTSKKAHYVPPADPRAKSSHDARSPLSSPASLPPPPHPPCPPAPPYPSGQPAT